MSTDAEQNLIATLRAWRDEEPRTGSHDEGDDRPVSSSAELPLRRWYGNDGGQPGSFPFTRGRATELPPGTPWVMGMYSGYATPKETKRRFEELLAAGQSGLSIALDLPTQMGLDSDDPLAFGEVGKVGVPLDTVDDLIVLFDGLPFERIRQIRTSANAIGPIFAAYVIAALDELSVDPASVRLMLQNDPLKEFSARGTFIFPPEESMRFAADVIEYCAAELPHWEPIEFCGYHVRDAGGTAIHEIAVATANGIAYLDEAVRRGVDIAEHAERIFLFLSSGMDIFEEAAKLRAARRLWARILRDRYDVPEEHCGVNIFVYTLGGALQAADPMNNVVRIAYEALAAAMAGIQTMATSSYDEALGLPTSEAARLALRTQQILAYESGAVKVLDPLGGSYYVEDLTDRLESEAISFLVKIFEQGGPVGVLESGFLAHELADAAYRLQLQIESGERTVVGVNFQAANSEGIATGLETKPELEREQVDGLTERRRNRDDQTVEEALAGLAEVAAAGGNTVRPLIACAKARVTIGESVKVLATAYGRHLPSRMV
ncbi:MAG TPA: methylmalonyl-CoA mutase family protein [Solirubrobacterales bacterium]|jgi:methylmalonyl-CoA mutase N-terminal domain/subunit|nr:methylmalonyl-CoA mutase family protein [Solirubrobacterales bacterium]